MTLSPEMEEKWSTCTELKTELAAEHMEGGKEAQGKHRPACWKGDRTRLVLFI